MYRMPSYRMQEQIKEEPLWSGYVDVKIILNLFYRSNDKNIAKKLKPSP
jgi:hypothetical protein